MADDLGVMIAAVIVAVLIMLVSAGLEMLNVRFRRKAEPFELHDGYTT